SAVWAEDAEDFARQDGEIDTVHGGERAVALDEATGFDDRLAGRDADGLGGIGHEFALRIDAAVRSRSLHRPPTIPSLAWRRGFDQACVRMVAWREHRDLHVDRSPAGLRGTRDSSASSE